MAVSGTEYAQRRLGKQQKGTYRYKNGIRDYPFLGARITYRMDV